MRSVHGIAYTRLWNEQLVSVVQEFATDFTPPQEAQGGGTGLYCGEQDMFCLDEAAAPREGGKEQFLALVALGVEHRLFRRVILWSCGHRVRWLEFTPFRERVSRCRNCESGWSMI